MKLQAILYAADDAPRHKYVVTLTKADRTALDRRTRTGTAKARTIR